MFQQPTVQRSATVVASALMLLGHRISKATPGGPALDSMARPLLMRRGGRRKMARRQPFTRKMKAARSPLSEAGGKRRRAPAGAEGAQRGAPAGAFSNCGPSVNRSLAFLTSQSALARPLRSRSKGPLGWDQRRKGRRPGKWYGMPRWSTRCTELSAGGAFIPTNTPEHAICARASANDHPNLSRGAKAKPKRFAISSSSQLS